MCGELIDCFCRGDKREDDDDNIKMYTATIGAVFREFQPGLKIEDVRGRVSDEMHRTSRLVIG